MPRSPRSPLPRSGRPAAGALPPRPGTASPESVRRRAAEGAA
ncbi:hypothetical protein ABZ606_24600 [Streptomyces sp. NPDC012461]|nr:hypothetical protein [Streptomyces sp. SID14436]